jgi:hypothetical protein
MAKFYSRAQNNFQTSLSPEKFLGAKYKFCYKYGKTD